MQTLPLAPDSHVLVLTGAGVSAESGVPTFRDSNGLWESHRVEEVASPGGFARDPRLVWRFYSQRREGAASVKPNPGHLALAALERRLGDRFLLATQNVDGLHRQAGSERMVEMHGHLFTSRCDTCERPPFPDTRTYFEEVPRCEACGRGRLRPHIVWFGEMLDPACLERIERFIAGAGARLIFLAVGTSGAVWPAAGLVTVARRNGGQTWLVNAHPADNDDAFHHVVRGKSGEVLPGLLGV
jgi:NAD-dependent deacetylase